MTRRRPTTPPGTKGIYDADPRIRAQTARAMVRSRQTISVTCAWPDCVDPETGQPRQFLSRFRKGKLERWACSPTHRMRLYRLKRRPPAPPPRFRRLADSPNTQALRARRARRNTEA